MTDKSLIILNVRKDKRCPKKLEKIITEVDKGVTNSDKKVLELQHFEQDKPHAMVIMNELPKEGARKEYLKALNDTDGIEAAF